MSASNWPLGLSSCGSQDMERAVFQGYAQAGIRYMEVSLDAYRYAALNLDAPKSYAQEAGVRLWSIHLPFNREFYNIAHLDSSRRAACLLEYCRLLEKASKAGISVAVVHPSSEPIDGAERALAMRQAKQSLRALAQAADGLGLVVAVENLPRTCLGRDAAEMLELLDADRRLMSCFDTNHLLTQSLEEYLQSLAGRIATLHVSDYDFVDEKHVLPGEGKIAWPSLLAKLRQIGYEGPFLYELGLGSTSHIRRPKPLRYEDFAANYAALLRGQIPAPQGDVLF